MVGMRMIETDDLQLQVARVSLDTDQLCRFDGVTSCRVFVHVLAAGDQFDETVFAFVAAEEDSAALERIGFERMVPDGGERFWIDIQHRSCFEY